MLVLSDGREILARIAPGGVDFTELERHQGKVVCLDADALPGVRLVDPRERWLRSTAPAPKAGAPAPAAPALDAVAAMRAHLKSRGIEPRPEVDVERRPGEPELAFAMRRRFAARNA
jgi:nucleotide-binding universal stress UspA family protein